MYLFMYSRICVFIDVYLYLHLKIATLFKKKEITFTIIPIIIFIKTKIA